MTALVRRVVLLIVTGAVLARVVLLARLRGWALVGPLATQARELAQRLQAQPWFVLLPDAAIAHARQAPGDALARWRAEAARSPAKRLVVTANAWVLERLDG